MDADEQAIRTLVADWLRASREGEVDQVLDLMATDAVFLVAGQPPMQGRTTFAGALHTLLREHRIDSHSEVEEVQVCGTMAYCRTRLAVSVTPLDGGPASHRAGYTLSIFRKEADGMWRLSRDANLLAPVAPP
ncbi:MAG: SgcJ/EcaC family oxidoreductase [Pseudomonadota bacterium]